MCHRCSRTDTIAHHFYLCTSVQSFWNDVFSFMNECTEKRVRPTLQNVMFGMLNVSPVLNLLLLIGKSYIYSCSARERPITFHYFLSRVIEEFDVEKRAAIGCSIKRAELRDRWKILNQSASGRLFVWLFPFLLCVRVRVYVLSRCNKWVHFLKKSFHERIWFCNGVFGSFRQTEGGPTAHLFNADQSITQLIM